MQTRREYAISLGLAKPTRGRMSREANEACDKAEAEGTVFVDTTSKPTAAPAPVVEGKTEPVKSKPGDSLYISPSDFRFPEAEYQAVAHIDGKRKVFGMRECCNTCRVSLTNHACASPSIHGNIAVTIERKAAS